MSIGINMARYPYMPNKCRTQQAKSDYLLGLLIDERVDILLLQETYTEDMKELTSRENLSGFKFISTINYPIHGIAIYAGKRLLKVDVTNNDLTYKLSTVTIKKNNLTITTYKATK